MQATASQRPSGSTIMKTTRDTRQRSGAILMFAGLASGLLLIGGCKKAEAPTPPPPKVVVMLATLTNVPRTVEFIGQLDSPQNVEVRARIEAFVEKILFTEGTGVKLGDPLFELDKKPFDERMAAAKGMLAEAKASLKKCQADVNRLTPLAEKKAIPQQDLDNALASVSVSMASVESAEARVKSAELDLGYCDVRAPITGLIGAKQVSVGSLVGKGEPTLLATISELDPIWFYCALSEVDYLHAQRAAAEAGRQVGDLPVRLFLADGAEHTEPGKWVFVDRAVDTTTGTIRARAQFPNPKRLLRPGMFGRLSVTIKTDSDQILVPERALVELQGKNFVWIIDAENKAAQRQVDVAPARLGSSAIILGRLKAGERVVIEGIQKVREGGGVEPITAEQAAASPAKE
jgi:membrane fusion protein (multidrug efflux system)